MENVISHSPAQTEAAGRRLGRQLRRGDFVALTGGLGMGKTQFIRGLARGLGYAGAVTSPTFTLVHEYPGPVPVYHFDMYRISNWDELESTGFFDYLGAGGVCAVEWSENIWEALPSDAYVVHIARGADEHSRLITIDRGIGHEDSGH